MKKYCKICGKEFEPYRSIDKCCSKECSAFAWKKYLKEYQKSEKFKKCLKEYQKKYQKSEKFKEYKKSEKYKEYYKSEKFKINNIKKSHKRRALKRNCIHEDYTSQLKEVKSLKTFTCYWCGENHDIKDMHLDHIIPLSKGGSDIWNNIALSCAHCNISKGAKLPEEFNKTLEQPRLII